MSLLMGGNLWFLLILWLAAMVAGLLHMVATWCLLHRIGQPVLEFRIFYGKKIASFVVFDTVVSLGCLPYGAYVRYDPNRYATGSLFTRIGVPLFGIAAVAVIAGTLLGLPHMVQSISTGFSQIISGALSPATLGRDLVARLFSAHSLPVFVGIVWSKYVAFHLLPAPVLPGGAWMIQLFDPKGETRWADLLNTSSALTLLAGQVSWIVAVWYFLKLSIS